MEQGNNSELFEEITRNAIFSSKETLPKIYDALYESQYGLVHSISSHVITAEKMHGASMYELVRVGHNELIGEIMKLEGDFATIQVYENISGLKVGDPVLLTGRPLSVELGPGILNNIFDGIQRPLKNSSGYIPQGLSTVALNRDKMWYFQPGKYKKGDVVTGGDIFGIVYENDLIPQHKMMVPPKSKGQITWIAPEGSYNLNETVLELEFGDQLFKFPLFQVWPIRLPRPCCDKRLVDRPLVTGIRVLDALFPIAVGGKALITRGIPMCKSIISISLSNSSSDVTVFVATGERSSDVSDMIMDYEEITTKFNNKDYELMNKTTVVACTPDMPVAVREASIFTGMTMGEYFRDQGMNVMIDTDSITRWALSLRELSETKEEVPYIEGYPASLKSQLSSFFERSGNVTCLGNPIRCGSVTLMSSVSPPGGDISEFVTSTAMSMVPVFWFIDKRLIQRIIRWPCIGLTDSSYSHYQKDLEPYYESYDKDYSQLSSKIKKILEKKSDIFFYDAAFDSLTEYQILDYSFGSLVEDNFICQNYFTTYDKFCPLYKTTWMMRNFVTYYDLASKALESHHVTEKWITSQTAPLLNQLSSMKFEEPSSGEESVHLHMKTLYDNILLTFESLNYDT